VDSAHYHFLSEKEGSLSLTCCTSDFYSIETVRNRVCPVH
jgi:hypothetical protein